MSGPIITCTRADCVESKNRLNQLELELKNQKLHAENEELKNDEYPWDDNDDLIHEYKNTIRDLDDKIVKLEYDSVRLNDKVVKLEHDNIKLKKDNDKMKAWRNRFRALCLVADCFTVVNETFRKVYVNTFQPDYDVYVPDIGIFINNPPTAGHKYYDFWNEFIKTYPGVNDKRFRSIYKNIHTHRTDMGAHNSVKNLSEHDILQALELGLSNQYKNSHMDCAKMLYRVISTSNQDSDYNEEKS